MSGKPDVNTYKCCVRVAKSGGIGTMVVWTQVCAQNPNSAKSQLEAQYGRGNVIGIPTLVS